MALSKRAQKRVLWVVVAISIILGGTFASATLYLGAINSHLVYLEFKMRLSYREAKSDFEATWTQLRNDTRFPPAHANDLRRVFAEVMAGDTTTGDGARQIAAMAKMIDPHAEAADADVVSRTLKNALAKQRGHRQDITDLRDQFNAEVRVFPVSLVAAYFGFPHIDHESQIADLNAPPEDEARRSKSNPFLRKK